MATVATSGGRSDLGTGFTAQVAEQLLELRATPLSPTILERVRHDVLDWIGVTIAGAREPSAQIARGVLLAEGGSSVARLVGTADRATASQATLANGIAGHALDFDNNGTAGHPSVPILSAVFALAEELGSSGAGVARAIVIGHQAMSVIGIASTNSSYLRGFHTTGTNGTFGATCGCASLLDLDALHLQRAIGLAATQAAGLKASFGTMGKHLNAAKAAANGLLAARLVAAGFTGATDAIESPQGFEVAHNATRDNFDPELPRRVLGSGLAIERLTYKTHASCGGTHSAIESINRLRASCSFDVDDVEHVELFVSESMPDVCGIVEPTTGLEGKFSIRYAASLALAGGDTGPDGFTDERVRDPELRALRQRIDVVPLERLTISSPSEVVVRLKSGESLTASVDARIPTVDAALEQQWARLVAKFEGLVAPALGTTRTEQLVALVRDMVSADSVNALTDATAP